MQRVFLLFLEYLMVHWTPAVWQIVWNIYFAQPIYIIDGSAQRWSRFDYSLLTSDMWRVFGTWSHSINDEWRVIGAWSHSSVKSNRTVIQLISDEWRVFGTRSYSISDEWRIIGTRSHSITNGWRVIGAWSYSSVKSNWSVIPQHQWWVWRVFGAWLAVMNEE